MLGRQSDLTGGEHPYLDHVRRDSFYGFLALHRQELFSDEDFSKFYCPDNGRPSVPPSLLATALLLQAYEGASDEEAKARADFDLRWKVALGVGLEKRPFAKSTLQLFRARLVIHERMQTVFRKRAWTSLAIQATSGAAGSRSFWTAPTSWAGERSRTPTICWPTGSSCWCGNWPPEPATRQWSGRASGAWGATSARL